MGIGYAPGNKHQQPTHNTYICIGQSRVIDKHYVFFFSLVSRFTETKRSTTQLIGVKHVKLLLSNATSICSVEYAVVCYMRIQIHITLWATIYVVIWWCVYKYLCSQKDHGLYLFYVNTTRTFVHTTVCMHCTMYTDAECTAECRHTYIVYYKMIHLIIIIYQSLVVSVLLVYVKMFNHKKKNNNKTCTIRIHKRSECNGST